MCLPVQVWTRWITHYKERMLGAWKMSVASHHLAVKQKQVVLRAWQAYVAGRRKKLYLNRVAVGCHSSCLLVKCYTNWKTRLVRSRQVAEFEDLIVLKSRLSTCWRVLGRWKFCILCSHVTTC